MNATTTKIVRLDWRDQGRAKYRTYTLEELRAIAATDRYDLMDENYSIDVPGGPIWHADGRTNWSNPEYRGASQILWINGDLRNLVEIAEAMIAGKTFKEIHARY